MSESHEISAHQLADYILSFQNMLPHKHLVSAAALSKKYSNT